MQIRYLPPPDPTVQAKNPRTTGSDEKNPISAFDQPTAKIDHHLEALKHGMANESACERNSRVFHDSQCMQPLKMRKPTQGDDGEVRSVWVAHPAFPRFLSRFKKLAKDRWNLAEIVCSMLAFYEVIVYTPNADSPDVDGVDVDAHKAPVELDVSTPAQVASNLKACVRELGGEFGLEDSVLDGIVVGIPTEAPEGLMEMGMGMEMGALSLD